MAHPRLPGLDGLRGLAVALVVVYHLWPARLPGGFLGVTVFFALSGFLLTRLLLEERAHTGRVAIGAFYVRRVARILPLAMGVLALIAVIWTVSGLMTASIARDLRFAVLQLANWGQVLGQVRYGDATEPSPLMHYWSLAIEEQTYLVVPVLLAVLSRRAVGAVMMLGLAVGLSVTLAAAGDPVVVYYSTFTRLSEFCAGALAAAALGVRPVASVGPAVRRGAGVVAILGLAGVLAATVTVSTQSEGLYRGGLWMMGLVAGAVVLAVVLSPRMGAVLDWRPLAALGRISYGVYVLHWPIAVGLGHSGLTPSLVPWITMLLTALTASASHRWVEQPLRRRAAPRDPTAQHPRRWLAAGSLAVLALLGAGTVVLASLGARADRSVDFEDLARRFVTVVEAVPGEADATSRPTSSPPAAPTAAVATTPVTTPATTRAAPSPVTGPLRYSYFGDSKALTLGFGISAAAPQGWSIGPSYTPLGCTLARHGEVRHPATGGRIQERSLADCDWLDHLERTEPTEVDVVVLWYGTWDLVDRRLPWTGITWHDLESPAYLEHLRSEFRRLIATLTTRVSPRMIAVFTTSEGHIADAHDRAPQMNRIWADLVADAPPWVRIIDIAGWLAAAADQERLLPDGIHPTFGEHDPADNTAAEIHIRFIDPTVRALLAQIEATDDHDRADDHGRADD